MKFILMGATGFVGEGVLLECLSHPDVEEVLSISRKPVGLSHSKLRQLIVPNFAEIARMKDQVTGYDACMYCVGVSSWGMDEATYTKITYDTTLGVAAVLAEVNPGMVFNFVSGRSTDSSEKGKVMWARVKGKTENALRNYSFKNQYNFRPGSMKPTPGQRNVKPVHRIVSFIYRSLFPGKTIQMREVGLAMINAVLYGYPKQTLEMEDIEKLAQLK